MKREVSFSIFAIQMLALLLFNGAAWAEPASNEVLQQNNSSSQKIHEGNYSLVAKFDNYAVKALSGTLEILTPSDDFTIAGAFDVTFRITNTGDEKIAFAEGDASNRIGLEARCDSWGTVLWSTVHEGLTLAPRESFSKTVKCEAGVYEGDMTITLAHWERYESGYRVGSLGKVEINGTIGTRSPVIGFYRSEALYSKLADYLEDFGYHVKYVDQSNFTSVDMVYLDYRSSPPEQDLLNYVKNGGNLWISGEAGTKRSLLGTTISDSSVEFWGSRDDPSRLWLREHQLTDGVSLITYPAGAWLRTNDSIEDIIRIDGHAILGIDESYKGRILWLIDSDIFGNHFLYDSDNEILAKNIANWLLEITPEEVVPFPDPNLEAAIRKAINKPKGDIYKSDLEGLTELDASEENISNLSGLEYCTDLKQLNLEDNHQISDISPLSGLTKLEHLDLDHNQITDISPLSELTKLEGLDLDHNQITDISPLSGLTKLEGLALDGNQISDVSPLSNLTNLQELLLWDNEISDISPLSELTNLRSLYLSDNKIADISPLSGLAKLGEIEEEELRERKGVKICLGLKNNLINDISPLVDNHGLSEGDGIDLRGNPLNDKSLNTYIPQLEERGIDVLVEKGITNPEAKAINFPDPNLEKAIREAIDKPEGDIYKSDLEGLTELDVSGKGISNLSGLGYCTNLAELNLSENRISDLSPLSNLTNLTSLELQENRINDISPLSNLQNLTHLDLGSNYIRDISPLSNLYHLRVLLVSHNQISDISPLSNLTGLTTLDLGLNAVSDLSPLSDLTMLAELTLMDNRISDISPVSNLTKLRRLNLSGNEISDISSLSELFHLRVLYLDNNKIVNVSPLSALTNLTPRKWGPPSVGKRQDVPICLGLQSNRITDIAPLLKNEGLREGDGIDLRGNPLNDKSLNTYIPQLEERGVNVLCKITPAPKEQEQVARDTLTVNSISPPNGTELQAGQTVTVTAKVSYTLASLDKGDIGLWRTKGKGRSISLDHQVVDQGSGTLILEGTFTVPELSYVEIELHLDPCVPPSQSFQPLIMKGAAAYVVVPAGNEPPVIKSLIANPQEVALGKTSEIAANVDDPEGDELTFSWECEGGTISGEGSAVTWTAPQREGQYRVTLEVRDGHGGSQEESVSIEAIHRNEPPIVNAGQDQETPHGLPFTFDGSSSYDPDGLIVSYKWDFGDGAIGTGEKATHTYPDTGLFTVTLTVTDDEGAVASDELSIQVTNDAPVIKGITCKPEQVTFGETSHIDAQVEDANGDELTLSWHCDGGTISGEGSSVTWKPPAVEGTYHVTLEVADGYGGTDKKVTTIEVIPANQPPAADPGEEIEATQGLPVTLDGSGSYDPDGSIISWEWDFGDGSTGSGKQVRHTYNEPGNYTVTLTVTDDQGAKDSKGTSATVKAATTIEGYITDADGNPILGATVTVHYGPNSEFSGETNNEGWYEIENVPRETADITVEANGYKPQSKELGSDETRKDFQLEAKGTSPIWLYGEGGLGGVIFLILMVVFVSRFQRAARVRRRITQLREQGYEISDIE